MVDESPEMIKSQMEQTRSSLAEKIETLEQQVSQTVKDATNAVSTTVETVKEVVDNTASAVQSTVDSVKQTFDLSGHVERSPWLMMGGAVMTGFVVGKLLEPSHAPSPAASAHSGNGQQGNKPEKQAEQKDEKSADWGLSSLFQKPLSIAQGVAVGTFFSLVQNVLQKAVPAEWSNQLLGVVEDLNRQFGGLALERPKPKADEKEGDNDHAERNNSKVGRALGATDRKSQEALGPGYGRRIDAS